MVIAAFLLGCQELADADVWWHLGGGQWILDHRRLPGLDPFTFSSPDRTWVDLHWLFQVTLAAAFAGGGVRGVILLTATLCTAAMVVVLALRDRRWPCWIVAACWLPALADQRPVRAATRNLVDLVDGPLPHYPPQGRRHPGADLDSAAHSGAVGEHARALHPGTHHPGGVPG